MPADRKKDKPKPQDPVLSADDIGVGMDTEGGQRHLTEVIAYTTLCGIIKEAIKGIDAERQARAQGRKFVRVKITIGDLDELVVKCEKVIVSYGEEAARKAMTEAVLECLERHKRLKQRLREMKADSFVDKRESY
jgi:hypothetical protein